MLKLIFISLFTILNTMAQEPDGIFVVSGGKMNKISFKNLKRVEITTKNYHPKFADFGEIKYSGYLVKDILAQVKLKPSDYVTVVGKTGQFSIELSVEELLAPNNIIATSANGEALKTEEKGIQIIYSKEAITKFPHLKKRYYWCWWVRSFITDEKFVPLLKAAKGLGTLRSKLPWPVPHGISSRGLLGELNQRLGRFLEFSKAKVNLLNGSSIELVNDKRTRYFLTDSKGNKAGGFGLHQIIEKNNMVDVFVSSFYYVKNLEVLK